MSLLPVAPLAELRRRRSVKWRTFDDDVLPLFVAEMDFGLAPPVADALREAVDRADLGYSRADPGLGTAYAGFADRRWGWSVDPHRVVGVSDVSVGVVELLRVLIRPGDPVVISPPVYPPFFEWVPEAGGRVHEVPLADGRLDLPALAAAFATHPAAYLLCNPQNPVGRVHTAEELTELVRLARLYRVPLISDEIFAPLTLPGAAFTPLLSVPGAADVAVTMVSASKAFNVAGLKCAAVVTGADRMTDTVRRLPREVAERTGHLGALASTAAFTDGDPWLDTLLTTLDARRTDLAGLLRTHLPRVRWRPPEATFLAWLDCTALGVTPTEPRDRFLAEARVALEPGPAFGALGTGFCRLNFATSPEILTEAVTRMGGVFPA